jgi:DNA-binding transcriptional ArsR family regulator
MRLDISLQKIPTTMSKIKLEIAKLENAASKMRAIAHPMRIAIIDMLNDVNKLSVTEIYERLNIEQAAASHHLNILKSKGVLTSKREGKKIFYSLKSKTLSQIIDCLDRCNEEV